jgi:hypothetical protein
LEGWHGGMNRRGAALTGTHWGLRKIRPHVGAAPAADPAHKPVLDVGQSKVVRPEVGADPDAMAADRGGRPARRTRRRRASHDLLR